MSTSLPGQSVTFLKSGWRLGKNSAFQPGAGVRPPGEQARCGFAAVGPVAGVRPPGEQARCGFAAVLCPSFVGPQDPRSGPALGRGGEVQGAVAGVDLLGTSDLLLLVLHELEP